MNENILPEGENPFETLSSRIISDRPHTWYRIRLDTVKNKTNGEIFYYTVSEIGPSVGVLAMDENDEIYLVGQWRYTFNKYSWELPTGSMDSNEDPLTAAKRELREETGVTARKWVSLGTLDNCNGATIDEGHIFLATDLTKQQPDHDLNEVIQVKQIPFQQAIDFVYQNVITEALSIACILKANHYLAHSL